MQEQELKGGDGTSGLGRRRWVTGGVDLAVVAQVGLFLMVFTYALYVMKPILLPLVLAVLVSLILYPIHGLFRKLRLPPMLCAAATVSGLIAAISFCAYQVFLPSAEWARNVDQEQLLQKVQGVFQPVKEVRAEIEEMADRVEEATSDEEEGGRPVPAANLVAGNTGDVGELAEGEEKPEFPGEVQLRKSAPYLDENVNEVETDVANEVEGAPVMVEVHEDPLTVIYEEFRDFSLGLLAFLLLVLFILAYGDRILVQLGKNERVAKILTRMGEDVSKYLFNITIINAGLGICVGLAMWGLGMPRPMLWGVMAFVLNYVPYLGALAGTFVIFIAAAVNFDETGMVLATPIVYFMLTAIEGNVVTPAVLGGRFKINPLVVFVWIFLWAGFWGIAGMLIAMPALVTCKILCENSERMLSVRRLLEA